MFLFKEVSVNIEDNPGVKVSKTNSAPTGFERITSILDVANYCFSLYEDYCSVRLALEQLVAEKADPPDVENGFDLCSSAEKIAAAQNKIGTGAQIAATITDVSERDFYSFQYIENMISVRKKRAELLESKLLSRIGKDDVLISESPDVYINSFDYIYQQLNINDAAAGELSGNLLELYKDAGIGGVSVGQNVLGLLDYIESTSGTRFASEGLATDTKLSSIVPSNFSNMSDFASYLSDGIRYGIW